jgi:hypothetical protein
MNEKYKAMCLFFFPGVVMKILDRRFNVGAFLIKPTPGHGDFSDFSRYLRCQAVIAPRTIDGILLNITRLFIRVCTNNQLCYVPETIAVVLACAVIVNKETKNGFLGIFSLFRLTNSFT